MELTKNSIKGAESELTLKDNSMKPLTHILFQFIGSGDVFIHLSC